MYEHTTSGFVAGSDADLEQIGVIAHDLRAQSWEVATQCVAIAIDEGVLPGLAKVSTVSRLANLPSFIGGVATALLRPTTQRANLGRNPIITRLAREHVIQREAVGFTARGIVQEFLLLRRVIWMFVRERADRLDTRTVLALEDRLNSILDEVIVECTVTYYERATHALSEKSRRDSLTGLLNHQAFLHRLSEELDRSRRYGHALQVIYMDLDDFKQVNDTHGHQSGDRLLQRVAAILTESIRETDFAGRLGGDEFVLCLVESDTRAAQLLIERLRARLDRAIAEGRIAGKPGLSAGCANFPTDGDNAEALLARADERLYADKAQRKGSQPSA